MSKDGRAQPTPSGPSCAILFGRSFLGGVPFPECVVRMARSVVDRIEEFNRGREPERLALKYRAMATGPFSFFRGTAHLFFEDWPRRAPWNRAPLGWISGDLHLENFGSFLGDNGLVYFDLNDFDEAALAPVTWETGRLLTSAYLAARELQIELTV